MEIPISQPFPDNNTNIRNFRANSNKPVDSTVENMKTRPGAILKIKNAFSDPD